MLDPDQVAQALLQTLRERLQPADGLFELPTPPTLRDPAGEDALRARGVKMQRDMLAVETGGDSFLRASAPELGVVDVDAYCAAQRAAVVGALELCSRSSVLDAALAASGCRSRDDWARRMLLPATPFDAVALMLYSLLNEVRVSVLGADAARDQEFNACSALECVTVGRLDAGCWAGFDEYRRMGVLPALPPPPVAKRAREGSPEAPPAQRRRREEQDGAAVALPVTEQDPARAGLLAEQKQLKERLKEVNEALRLGQSSCFYLVRHPMETFRDRGYIEKVHPRLQQLIETQHWVVVGFGRTEYALQAYSNRQGRLDGEFFATRIQQDVYAFRREDVLVWQEDAPEASASLERLVKAVLAFTQRNHAPARALRELTWGSEAVCAFDHPACCILHLHGWVDETLLMHPALWTALQEMSAPHELLGGGRVLTCDAETLQDALVPASVRLRHANLNPVRLGKAEQA
jgi:hypothetical protein